MHKASELCKLIYMGAEAGGTIAVALIEKQCVAFERPTAISKLG